MLKSYWATLHSNTRTHYRKFGPLINLGNLVLKTFELNFFSVHSVGGVCNILTRVQLCGAS